MRTRTTLPSPARLSCVLLLATLCTACINLGAEGSSTWGTAVFYVLDQQDDPVPGVTLSLEFDAPPTPHVMVTDSAGMAETAGAYGMWPLTIDPPDGFAIPPGALSTVLVRIRRGRTIEYVLRLDRKVRQAPVLSPAPF